MSVRGTTHARLSKKVVILEGAQAGDKILCGWLDCDNDGLMLYQAVTNAARPGYGRRLERYVFCTERHRQYFLHQMGRGLVGRLPSGERGRIG